MAMLILKSKFSTVCRRLRWQNLRSLYAPRFLSTNENDNGAKSQSDESENENSGHVENVETVERQPSGKSGIEKAVEMFERVEQATKSVRSTETAEEKPPSFASMLRHSKLIGIGKPEGRLVVGTIFEVMNDDLYIDFGGKFHCVCKAPRTNTE